VVLDKNIRLLDSPGVVFQSSAAGGAALLRNAVKARALLIAC
jgi:ribosome biogenesis GTPase A